MLYLIDANVLITANNTYYPIERIPQYWEWLKRNGDLGKIKFPQEIYEEVTDGNKDDPLVSWIKQETVTQALRLTEEVDQENLRYVVKNGYAPDLDDEEVEAIGKDPFLIAYALNQPDRTVVSSEVSKPSKTRQHRRIPDVCNTLSINFRNQFELNETLNFSTN